MFHKILRPQRVRNTIPNSLKVLYSEYRALLFRVKDSSSLKNVFHCCVHKTGSQWIRKIFSDPRVYEYSGLRLYSPDARRFRIEGDNVFRKVYLRKFPANRIVSPLYVDYPTFSKLKGIGRKGHAIFVTRDPRDIVVSWYFSTLYSHPVKSNLELAKVRKNLHNMPKKNGLCFVINHLRKEGLFEALDSWQDAHEDAIMIVRYEDLLGNEGKATFGKLFQFCEIRIPTPLLCQLIDDYSFEKLSGRKPGQEDINSKYRKGEPGDWENHFDDEVLCYFYEVTKDLVDKLGYNN